MTQQRGQALLDEVKQHRNFDLGAEQLKRMRRWEASKEPRLQVSRLGRWLDWARIQDAKQGSPPGLQLLTEKTSKSGRGNAEGLMIA